MLTPTFDLEPKNRSLLQSLSRLYLLKIELNILALSIFHKLFSIQAFFCVTILDMKKMSDILFVE